MLLILNKRIISSLMFYHDYLIYRFPLLVSFSIIQRENQRKEYWARIIRLEWVRVVENIHIFVLFVKWMIHTHITVRWTVWTAEKSGVMISTPRHPRLLSTGSPTGRLTCSLSCIRHLINTSLTSSLQPTFLTTLFSISLYFISFIQIEWIWFPHFCFVWFSLSYSSLSRSTIHPHRLFWYLLLYRLLLKTIPLY